MFEQLSKILVSDILVKLFKSYPQLKPISSAIADEVVNKVIIGNTNPLSVQYSIEDIQKSLSSPEPSLSQLGLQNVLSRSFLNRIDGTPLDDFILGTLGDDLIFAQEGDDIVIGLAGNDIVFAEDGDDIIFGGPISPGVPDNDLLFGGNGDDTFYGGEGDDVMLGGPGKDTVDYRFLNQGITLEAIGLIDKGNAGVDQIFEVETIIGNALQINSIDASTGNGNALIEVDLSSEILSVVGTPVGNFLFKIKNFSNVTGSNNQDTIIGNKANNKLLAEGGNDFIGGSAGDDIIDGGFGFDTIDYQNLGQAITLEAAGKVDKGFLGKDLLNNVERIVADGTKTNEIDGSTGTGTASLKVDLANND
ncbi:MAG: calcium-binding protein, partial [Crocosphaera sp.]